MKGLKITIAISKGRIFRDTLPLLEKCGVFVIDDPKKSRKLRLDTNFNNVKILFLRATDVPVYVQHGIADLGISGKDVLLEQNLDNIYEPLDLEIAKCKMVVAKQKNKPISDGKIKIATKYPTIAKDFFYKKGRQTDVIKLYGAMELAPITGLSDIIVDLVETGETLKANGLEIWQEITDISSRLIVNKASMKTKHSVIKNFINCLDPLCSNLYIHQQNISKIFL